MVDKIYEANQFRNMLLAMNNEQIPPEVEMELLEFIAGNKNLPQNSLKKSMITHNLRKEFGISFTILDDGMIKVLEDYPSDKWREICAKEARDREIFFFGDSNIDIETWVPEGWNF